MHERINFNPYTVNIFTDSSVKNVACGFDSCSAVCTLLGDNVISSRAEINRGTTNNFGEMYAIYMGVCEALQYIIHNTPVTCINLYSDSRISVLGLKQWYKNWVLDSEGYLVGSTGRIANQNLICSIINMIITYKIKISFYHIKGHTNLNKQSEFEDFKIKFRTINGDIGPSLIEDEVFEKLIRYNDHVDTYSRNLLSKSQNNIYNMKAIIPVNKFCNFDKLDLDLYSKLIDPRYHF